MIKSLNSLDVDRIINHATVRLTAQGGLYHLDSRPVFQRGGVAYGNEDACAIFLPISGGVWEGHIFCKRGQRGAAALKLGKLALGRLFTDHRASKLVAAVPLLLPQARVYCRRLGLRSVEVTKYEERFELEVSRWAE